MTNEEAINYFKRSYVSGDTDDERQHNEALDMAIKALEVVKGIEDAYMSELLKTPTERNVPISDTCDGCRYELNSTNGNPCYSCGKCKLTEQQPCEACFTDDEKRIFLASVAREMRVCEQIDSEKTKVRLVPIIQRVKEKVLRSSLWKGVSK